MVKPARPSAARTDDAATLVQQVAALQRENAELKTKLAKGPVDDSWFTPGVLSLLALALFFALWAKYSPLRRAPAAEAATTARPAGEYNPTAPAAAAPTPAAPAPSGGR